MKMFILISVIFLGSLNLGFSNNFKILKDGINIDSLRKVHEIYSKKTIEDIRNKRFEKKPEYGLYEEDDDSYIIGSKKVQDIQYIIKRAEIQMRILESNSKKIKILIFKSTYLDFVILKEENIS